MRGLAVYTSPHDDPYITSHKDDSEDEREADAMRIRPDDNLAIVSSTNRTDKSCALAAAFYVTYGRRLFVF